jgi:hypothetical protein
MRRTPAPARFPFGEICSLSSLLFTVGFTGTRCKEDTNGSSSPNGRRMLRGGFPPVPCLPGVTLAVHWNTCTITAPLQRRSRFIILSLRTERRCNCAASQDVRTAEVISVNRGYLVTEKISPSTRRAPAASSSSSPSNVRAQVTSVFHRAQPRPRDHSASSTESRSRNTCSRPVAWNVWPRRSATSTWTGSWPAGDSVRSRCPPASSPPPSSCSR